MACGRAWENNRLKKILVEQEKMPDRGMDGQSQSQCDPDRTNLQRQWGIEETIIILIGEEQLGFMPG